MSAVPKLRFPEFDGEWSRSRIDEIGTLKSGVGFPEKEQGGFEGTPFYKVSDMNTPENSQEMVLANHYVTEEQIKRLKYKPIASDSIIFAKVGAAIFLDRKRQARNFLLDNNMMAFLPSSEIDFRFIYQVFLQINLAKFAQVGALPSYNASDIGIIKTHIPTLPEQQKIASFLSSVDKKIDLLRKKKDALELYKQGLMQKIFSQEIRFKQDDGNDFPDWEEVTLGGYSSFLLTNSLSRADLADEGIVQNVHYGDIHTRYAGQYDQCAETTPYISDPKIAAKLHEKNQLQRGDIVIADASEDYADIGKAIEIVSISHTPLFAGLHTIAMRPNPQKFYVSFGSYLFQSTEVRRQIYRLAQGAKVLGLSKGNIQTLLVSLPCLSEQKKISEFISAVDRHSQRHVKMIEQMETFKKGLLQQMFV